MMRQRDRVSQTVLKADQNGAARPSDEEDDDIHRISLPPPPPLADLSRTPVRGVPPPPPPAGASRLFARSVSAPERALLASVRIDGQGNVMSSFGDTDLLSQLVAYVTQLMALVQAELSLDPFAALHAELEGKRVLVFEDAGETVGLLMRPGPEAHDLRQRLGV